MSSAVAAGQSEARADDRWGHPRQLWMLLGVTVGLNFAFYGFRAFLAPYIAQSSMGTSVLPKRSARRTC